MSDEHIYKNFALKYHEVRHSINGLTPLDNSELHDIQHQFTQDNTQLRTQGYLLQALVIGTSILSTFSLWFWLSNLPDPSKEIMLILDALIIKDPLFPNHFAMGIPLLILLYVIYLYHIPHLTSLNPNEVLRLTPINTKSKRFYWVRVLLGYTLLMFITTMLWLLKVLPNFWLAKVLNFLLYVPASIAAVPLTFYLCSAVYLALFPVKFRCNGRLDISYRILILLESLSRIKTRHGTSASQMLAMITQVMEISKRIHAYPEVLNRFPGTEHLKEHYCLAAIAFEEQILQILGSPGLNSVGLQQSLVFYFNTIISGQLEDLPKASKVPVGYFSKKPSRFRYVFIAVYLLIPIAVVFVLHKFFELSADEGTNSVFRICYFVYAGLVILSNPILFNADTRDFLKDILKTGVGK
jgi:hypothetical protein